MSEINVFEWENRVRDDQSVNRATFTALMALKTRNPNIKPGIVQFMKDARVKDRHTAIEYLRLARESGYVTRVHEGTHEGDVDIYELSYPELVPVSVTSGENPHQSLVGKNHTRVVGKNHTSTSVEKPHPKHTTKATREDYKRPAPDGLVARKKPDSVKTFGTGLAKFNIPPGIDTPRKVPVPVSPVPPRVPKRLTHKTKAMIDAEERELTIAESEKYFADILAGK